MSTLLGSPDGYVATQEARSRSSPDLVLLKPLTEILGPRVCQNFILAIILSVLVDVRDSQSKSLIHLLDP